MQRISAKFTLPAFTEEELREPARIHLHHCPGALQINGKLPRGRCRCQSANSQVYQGDKGDLHFEKGDAALVSFDGYGPVWVEKVGLLRIKAIGIPGPNIEPVLGPKVPPDLEATMEALKRPLRFPRRRRPIKGGELVFVRAEKTAGLLLPKRFFWCAKGSAALIDPRLSPEQAMSPDWCEVEMVTLPGGHNGPARVLFPVFPLPDGTEDPGWRAP